eukprot:403333018
MSKIDSTNETNGTVLSNDLTNDAQSTGAPPLRKITKDELEKHNQEGDCWVHVNGRIYDLSNFYRKHPGGPDTIMEYAGKDGTERFEEAGHTKGNRLEMETYLVGEYQAPKVFTKLEEIADHNSPNDLWLLINNKVYDVSNFKHPGGKEILVQNAGMDATTQFEDINHSVKALKLLDDLCIGEFKNPDDDQEPWEDYIRRKQKEEEAQLSTWQKLVLVGLFIITFSYLYNYLTGQTANEETPVDI